MVEERIITINMSAAYNKPTTKRGNRALKLLRFIAARHAKVEEGAVRISPEVSIAVWNGRYHSPLKSIKVKLVPVEGMVRIMLPEETEAKKEVKVKEEKKTEKKQQEKKEEKPKEEKHIGGERKAPGEKEEKTEEEKQKEKERRDLNKMKK